MQRSPKYKSIDLDSIKDRQKYFKNLYDDVNKSRMAVETITSFKNAQLNFKKKIDEIQEELHTSISRINHESKKNVILKELINLMKGQMFDFQKNLKKEEEKNESEVQKKIKKIQYDIEQILQKHNEEIAKITTLKESASSGRSQRVVFSNLFKKLEKQIKQNEQIYKENLIKSEIARDKCKPIKPISRVLQKESQEHTWQKNHVSETKVDIFPVENNFFITNEQDTALLTVQRERSSEGDNSKRGGYPYKQIRPSQVHDMKNSSKGFNDMISCYENFIEKIKVYMGCTDIDEGISFYRDIKNSNEGLASQIEFFNEEISRMESSIKEIRMQKRQLDCQDNRKQVGSCRRIASSQPLQENQGNCQEQFEIMSQISQLLNMSPLNQQMNDDDLIQLDSKLDLMIQDSKPKQQSFNQQQPYHHRATTATSEGNVVDILLQRMDKFNQCEKILDKNTFQQEYFKELGKNKKQRAKK